MKKAIFFWFAILFCSGLHSQNAVHKRWDARFGGLGFDEMRSLTKVNGGYILNGYSESGSGGNKTQNSHGDADCWIVKIDDQGNLLWDKNLGGFSTEITFSSTATTDGGCLIAATTTSGISGDVSQPSHGGPDFWLVKLDSLGNKIWDKRFGGSDYDALYSARPTRDGGYILAGASASPISGDKSQANRDTTGPTADYWIVKIDSLGNKQWDKRFGSTEEEGCIDVNQTPDGGYLLGGSAGTQDANGDKSEPSYGGSNFWIVKVDSNGNKLWDRVYGGTTGEQFTNALIAPDGSYLLAGSTASGRGGNKTTEECGMWVVRVDPQGNKTGEWVYGSGINCAQGLGHMSATDDGGYLLTGRALPITGGDKRDTNLSEHQVWTIKIDAQMHRVWDKTCLSINDILEQPGGAVDCGGGCYLIGVVTNAGIGGDKTQAAWDSSYDYWVVQYCDTLITSIPELIGKVNLSIYPNPTAAEVTITLQMPDLSEAQFALRNTAGQIIYQSTDQNLSDAYTKILDIRSLPSAVYMLTISVGGQTITRQIIKL